MHTILRRPARCAARGPARASAAALAAVLAAAAGSAALTACAARPADPDVPAVLQPGAGARAAFTLVGQGVQIYECRAGTDGRAPAWAFVAPEARLLDAQGRPAGEHGAGPFWQARDGSRIVGKVQARADAPNADAVPWLLLSTRADAPGGEFGAVTQVQRVHTVGGVAPTDGCDAGSVGRRRPVRYRADYRFFVGP